MDFGQQSLLFHHVTDYLSMCDWNHARTCALTISKGARLLLHRPFFLHKCRGEFASKEGEYIRNIHISMLMRLCHSAFTLCALPRSRRPSVNFPSAWTLCDARICCTDARICGPLQFQVHLYSPREGNEMEIYVRGDAAKHVCL